jgi:hypothetical protein
VRVCAVKLSGGLLCHTDAYDTTHISSDPATRGARIAPPCSLHERCTLHEIRVA